MLQTISGAAQTLIFSLEKVVARYNAIPSRLINIAHNSPAYARHVEDKYKKLLV